MTRLRKPPATPSTPATPEPPADLKYCHVEDWLTEAEIRDFELNPPDDGDWQFRAEREANRRHKAFRQKWMDDRGINYHDSWAIWPASSPRWRSHNAYPARPTRRASPTHKGK